MGQSNHKRKKGTDIAISALERNLTSREIKLPYFKFSITNNSCSNVSLSGSEAQLVLAETEELKSDKVTSLFHGVWTKKSITDLTPTVLFFFGN